MKGNIRSKLVVRWNDENVWDEILNFVWDVSVCIVVKQLIGMENIQGTENVLWKKNLKAIDLLHFV